MFLYNQYSLFLRYDVTKCDFLNLARLLHFKRLDFIARHAHTCKKENKRLKLYLMNHTCNNGHECIERTTKLSLYFTLYITRHMMKNLLYFLVGTSGIVLIYQVSISLRNTSVHS